MAFQSDPTKLVGTVSVVGGTVAVTQSGIWATSMVGVASVSQAGAWNVGVIGSVAAFMGGAWTTSVVGTVAATQSGTWAVNATLVAPSIVGTYAEDSGHTSGSSGLFTLGVRNDAVASFVSANLEYTPRAVDSAGRMLVKPFAPDESRVYGVASTVNTNPSSLFSDAGSGLRNYITDVYIANTGSVATLVTFRDGDASILARTIAPAGGGSNIVGLQIPIRTGGFNQPIEYTSATATSILHVTAYGYKAP